MMFFLPLLTNSQKNQATVKLKNGTTLSGVMKSIDQDALTIVIAGAETKLQMSDVDIIEEVSDDCNQDDAQTNKNERSNVPYFGNEITHNLNHVAFDTNGAYWQMFISTERLW